MKNTFSLCENKFQSFKTKICSCYSRMNNKEDPLSHGKVVMKKLAWSNCYKKGLETLKNQSCSFKKN